MCLVRAIYWGKSSKNWAIIEMAPLFRPLGHCDLNLVTLVRGEQMLDGDIYRNRRAHFKRDISS